MDTLLQNPLIKGRFDNDTDITLNLTVQSNTLPPLVPGGTSEWVIIKLSGLMAMEMNIHDNDGNNLSNPTLMWQGTTGQNPAIFQQANRFFEWEPVTVDEGTHSGYHFNLTMNGDSLVIIGTVELVEEDLVKEKAHA